MKISWSGKQKWLEICAIFFQIWSRGNEEECKLFRNFFSLLIISYIFPKRQVSQTLDLYSRTSLIRASNILLRIQMHTQRLTQWHTKVIPKVVWDWSYPANHCIPPITSSFSGHYFYNSSFWVHTRIMILLLV